MDFSYSGIPHREQVPNKDTSLARTHQICQVPNYCQNTHFTVSYSIVESLCMYVHTYVEYTCTSPQWKMDLLNEKNKISATEIRIIIRKTNQDVHVQPTVIKIHCFVA